MRFLLWTGVSRPAARAIAASLEWMRANLGGLRRVTTVPRAKLFRPEEHPRLLSVLLKEFWAGN